MILITGRAGFIGGERATLMLALLSGFVAVATFPLGAGAQTACRVLDPELACPCGSELAREFDPSRAPQGDLLRGASSLPQGEVLLTNTASTPTPQTGWSCL